MELAEWLVRRAAELVSRVQHSARYSSMMHILHSCNKKLQLCGLKMKSAIAQLTLSLVRCATSAFQFYIVKLTLFLFLPITPLFLTACHNVNRFAASSLFLYQYRDCFLHLILIFVALKVRNKNTRHYYYFSLIFITIGE